MFGKINTFIETQRCNYRHPTHGNLGLRGTKTSSWFTDLNQSFISPLHEQFGDNINRCYPIRISLKIAIAGEQSLSFAVILADISTAIARSTGVSWTHRYNINSKLERNTFHSLPELTVWHSLDFPVALPAGLSSVKTFEVFNSDTCIVFDNKPYDFMCYLIASGFSEVSFIFSELLRSTPRSMAFIFFALEDAPSNSNISFDSQNISPEVKLFRDVTVNDKRNSSKNDRSDINSNYIGFFRNLKSLVKRYKDNPVLAFSSKLELSKFITVVKKSLKPFVGAVLLDKNVESRGERKLPPLGVE
jgi:hypothetical protein